MGSLSIAPHLSVAQIREQLYSCNNGRHASYWQIILTLSLNPGRKAKEYASLLGCSERKLYRIRALYNKEGADFTNKLLWGGRREACCLMSFEQEATLLQTQMESALQGEVLVAKQLRKLVANKVGHQVWDDYLWDLLHRHGWSKKAPRPAHPKTGAVKDKREVFKKKSLNFQAPQLHRQSP
jgi:transposase